MFLARVIYASKRTEKFQPGDIQEILETANQRNPLNGITGILFFHADYFIQAVEGGRSEVNALYSRICSDSRHTGVEMLEYKTVVQREFSEWSMGYLGEYSKTEPTIKRFSTRFTFDPFKMNGESAVEFLKSLRSFL